MVQAHEHFILDFKDNLEFWCGRRFCMPHLNAKGGVIHEITLASPTLPCTNSMPRFHGRGGDGTEGAHSNAGWLLACLRSNDYDMTKAARVAFKYRKFRFKQGWG